MLLMPDPPNTPTHPGSGEIRRLGEVARAFLKLGLTSFGGPVAHIGYLRAEFVTKRRWLDEPAYADLVALCQFLPGPASSQLVFALGMSRCGWLGGVLASLMFTLPSAVLMIAFGCGVAALGDLHGARWVHGLKLAAVAVVAQAVWGMARALCPDPARAGIAALAATALLVYPGGWLQIAVIGAGAAAGWILYRRRVSISDRRAESDGRRHIVPILLLAAFAALLAILPILSRATAHPGIISFDGFYRAGSMVFGGGHVILPLLRAEVVPDGAVADDTFLAGYGAAQALPGPLFTFAGYLGTVMHGGSNRWLGGLWCILAIFLPGWLLIAGTLPYWHQLRAKSWVQACLRGANAAVVGVLLAALVNPVWMQGVRNVADFVIAGAAFGLLQWLRLPPLLVVAMVVGACLLPVG